MRGVFWAVLVFGLVLAGPLASWAERQEAVRLQGLAVRRGPEGDAPMVRALAAGDVVTVGGRQGDYVAVTLADGTSGYVHGGFLTGFDDIAPLAAYAGRIDAGVKRPAGAKAGKPATGGAPPAARPAKAFEPEAGHEAFRPASSAAPAAYAPVTDGGGLALYMARLARPEPSRLEEGPPDDQIAEFLSSKNRYSIEVWLSRRVLYLYENLPDGSRHLARRYTVAVPGRDMEAPQGWGVVTGISFEPWWRPTQAMKERALKKGRQLPEVVKPGVKENPMGPFKIILSHGFGYRIHGNNNPGSIGRPVTSGCIRMQNDEGKDMAKMIDVGTEVVFLQ